MTFLTTLINGTVQERTILLHESQTDLKLERKAERQTVRGKNTEDGNKAGRALIFRPPHARICAAAAAVYSC